MPSPEAERFHELLRAAPRMVDMTLLDQRAAGERAEDLTAEPEDVVGTEATGEDPRGLWAIPAQGDEERVILYLFGGGHVITSSRPGGSSPAIWRSPPGAGS